MDVVGVSVGDTAVVTEILIKIFFCYFLADGDLVISLSFFCEDSTFIYFLERLKGCCFALDKIYIILLRLNSFLDNKNSVSDLLLLLLLSLYFLSTLIVLLIIVISVVSEIFFFFGKAPA